MEKTFWNIYKTFFKVGTLLLGGGYVILPLLQSELVDKKGWATHDELCEFYALGQSLPGIIAANMSIFVGYKLLRQKGAFAAASGIITPAFLTIILIAKILEELINLKFIQSIFWGVGIGVVILILLAVKEMWNKIKTSILPNGYFVGNFFGQNDDWYSTRPKMTFLTKEQVVDLFREFEIIRFKEIEEDKLTGLGKMKHWHTFNVIAKRK